MLRALRLAPGEHTVEFRFDPQSLRVTNTLGIVSVALIYALCLAALAWWTYRFVHQLNRQHPGENQNNSAESQDEDKSGGKL